MLQDQLAHVDEAAIAEYEKLRGWLKEEQRLLKILHKQARETLGGSDSVTVSFAMTGTMLSLKGQNIKVSVPLPAVLVSKVPGPGQFPFLVCLGQDNRWYVAAVKDVVVLHSDAERVSAAETLRHPNRLGDEARLYAQRR